jgi:6-phospho-3-hexuloisomerase
MSNANDFDVKTLGIRACQDLETVFSKFESSQFETLCQELLSAKRIVCYGVGREGLIMAAIAMRLMHAGFKSYLVGEMVTPPVGPGDVFLTSAGPGHFPTI